MAPALAMVVMAAEPTFEWGARHVPPPLVLQPFTPAELYRWFKGGEPTADQCEKLLAWSSRARGGIDLGLAEGFHALQKGQRLPRLGFHLDDFAREILDVGKRAGEVLALLGRELQTRPLLREALRSGRVRLRAAETVVSVAKGEAEAVWVERAATMTVRQLEAAVHEARAEAGGKLSTEPDGKVDAEQEGQPGVEPEGTVGAEPGGKPSPESEAPTTPAAEDEAWHRFVSRIKPEERAVLDEGLAVAGRLLPGSSRIELVEALTQEFLGQYPGDPEGDASRRLNPSFGPALGPSSTSGDGARKAALEQDTGRWAALPPVGDWEAPEVTFPETATCSWFDRLTTSGAIGPLTLSLSKGGIQQSGMYHRLGFASFEHYCDERLGLPARTVEQRAALERKVRRSPALQEARRQGVCYEKLRLLATLPEQEIGPWTPKAHGLTCIALRRRLEARAEGQMRARHQLRVTLPRRVAVLLTAAIQVICDLSGALVSVGRCLAVIAQHFLDTWRDAVKRSPTRSQRVRERDGHVCTVPGCSRRSAHAHHIDFKSHGGSDDAANQTATCGYHHLDCIHPGHLKVLGVAPDGLTWIRGEEEFTGRPS